MAQPLFDYHGEWTEAALDALPEDGNRYEVIDGALHVSPAPGPRHQIRGDRWRKVKNQIANRVSSSVSQPSAQLIAVIAVTAREEHKHSDRRNRDDYDRRRDSCAREPDHSALVTVRAELEPCLRVG